MATLIVSSEGSSPEIMDHYTEISTDVAWEETTTTEYQLPLNQWNATTSSTTAVSDSNLNMTHVVLASLALLIINLAVIIGNILVLLAVYCERALRTVTNYFIVNLAIADLLLGTLVLPFSSAFEVIHFWPFGGTFCDMWAAVDVLCCTASINSLCCISVDRYIGVTKPLKHRLIMTPRRAIMINVFVWLVSFGIAVGPLFGWRPVKTSKMECPLSDSVDYVFFSVAGSFYIPSTIILVLYFRIYRAVSRETRAIQDRARTRDETGPENGHAGRVILRIHVGNSTRRTGGKSNRRTAREPSFGSARSRNLSQRTATFNREKKVAKTLGIVVGVFIICWLPFFFLLPLTSVCKSCQLPKIVFTFFFWLGYCNSCVNPIIYAMSNLTFRKAFRKIITCWYCRDRPPLRRNLGSRRFSNLSRLTSSTPASSPMVACRAKRTAPNSFDETSTVRNERVPRRGGMRQMQMHNRLLADSRTLRVDVYDVNSNAHCGLTVARMSTIESESTSEEMNSLVADEPSKSPELEQNSYIVDKSHIQRNPTNTTDATLTNSNSIHAPLAKLVPPMSIEQCLVNAETTGTEQAPKPSDDQFRTANSTSCFSFNELTDQELSNGILESRETPV